MKASKLYGATLLVSCTTIGGALLSLPLRTVAGGFIPSALGLIICWFFMTIAALYILEATLWFNRETNLITIAQRTLGWQGAAVTWLIYMSLLYALLSAYLMATSAWSIQLYAHLYRKTLLPTFAVPLVAFTVGMIIFLGTRTADYFNRVLAAGLIVTYLILVCVSSPHIRFHQLNHIAPLSILPVFPLMITTFGFAIVVPSLTHYLDYQPKKMQLVVILGSLIPLLFYLLWQMITLGTLGTHGPQSLAALAAKQANGTEVANALSHVIGNSVVSTSVHVFSILAIITSFIGASLSLYHFLADGLKVPKTGGSGFTLLGITILPPVLQVLCFPASFDRVLSFGGIFVALLLGLLPVFIVYRGRYKHRYEGTFQVPGGQPLMLITAAFFVLVILQELVNYS